MERHPCVTTGLDIEYGRFDGVLEFTRDQSTDMYFTIISRGIRLIWTSVSSLHNAHATLISQKINMFETVCC